MPPSKLGQKKTNNSLGVGLILSTREDKSLVPQKVAISIPRLPSEEEIFTTHIQNGWSSSQLPGGNISFRPKESYPVCRRSVHIKRKQSFYYEDYTYSCFHRNILYFDI